MPITEAEVEELTFPRMINRMEQKVRQATDKAAGRGAWYGVLLPLEITGAVDLLSSCDVRYDFAIGMSVVGAMVLSPLLTHLEGTALLESQLRSNERTYRFVAPKIRVWAEQYRKENF